VAGPRMNHSRISTTLAAAFVLAVATMALVNVVWGRTAVPGSVGGYLVLALFPGWALYVFLERRPTVLRLVAMSVALSPIITGTLAVVLLLSHVRPHPAAGVLTVLFSVLAVPAFLRTRRIRLDGELTARRAALIACTVLVVCGVTGYLPLAHPWWRYWSDGWFHGAVVAQIAHAGIPPEDPYFAGLALQYMWIYHVLVLALSEASRISPMLVMSLVNLQALAGFALCSYLVAVLFRKHYGYGLFAMLTVVFGLNAVVWVFFPLKAMTAFTGHVRGWTELARRFSISPFDMWRARAILTIDANQTFMLNKFIVSTAFSLGLCYLAAFWYGLTLFLSRPSRLSGTIAFAAMLGMLAFHPLVAFIMFAGLIGGAVITYFVRAMLADFSFRRLWGLLLLSAAAFVLASPYLYQVMHLKRSENLFPLAFSVHRTAALLMACVLVIGLSAFQVKGLLRKRRMLGVFVTSIVVTLFVVCNIVRLPGPNAFDKPPFLFFYPLAVIGAWTFADRLTRRHATARYKRKVTLVTLLLLLPINVFALASYYHTPVPPVWTQPEMSAARWARQHTPRDALFFESGRRVIMLNAGPRRYYWGIESYADQWGYSADEIARRRHVQQALYSSTPLDAAALSDLGALPSEAYVLIRPEDRRADGSDKLDDYPKLFARVFDADSIYVYKVERKACLDAARALPPGRR
jgi:hypothetical protein